MPYLVRSPEELERIAVHNKELIGGEERYSRHLYMTPESYRQVIDQRVHDLVTTYPERSWKELNLADARAYAALRGTGNE